MATLKGSMDILFSNIIREKAKWVCERCGRRATGRNMQCSHITTRKYLTTRWSEINANCLCDVCHRYFHDHPAEYGPWLDEKFPGRRKEIQRILREDKVKPHMFKAIREKLKERLCQLQQ